MKNKKSAYQKMRDKFQKQVEKIDSQKRTENRLENFINKCEELRNARLRKKAYMENDLANENIQAVSNL